ncbi:hypothetical protein ACFE04_020845 [Oxalis oulophora]
MKTPSPYRGNDHNNSSGLTEKRKRGRPRKYANPNFTYVNNNAHVTMQHNISYGGHVQSFAPGIRASNGDLPRKVDENGVNMGQTILGVIEATFDVGYLLTMKVGNTKTTLKRLVFKPDHYVHVGLYNDMVSRVQYSVTTTGKISPASPKDVAPPRELTSDQNFLLQGMLSIRDSVSSRLGEPYRYFKAQPPC